MAVNTFLAVVNRKPRIVCDPGAIHSLALGQSIGQAIFVKMNGGESGTLLGIFSCKNSLVLKVRYLIVCFDFNLA